MITNLNLKDNVGIITTNKHFVLLVDNGIYGPFNNEDWKQVYGLIKEIEVE